MNFVPGDQRVVQLENLYLTGPLFGDSASFETLVDVLICLFDECCNSTLRKEKNIAEFVERLKSIVNKAKSLRLRRDDFDVLKVIGRGAFGEVAVVRMKNTDKIFAMKILNKWEMLKRAETACFKEERDVLVFGDRRWITNLHYAFQDEKNLYLIMDYYVGGDMLTLLSKFEDRLPEDMAKFYICEMVLAIDSVHRLGYVHRDIKPDNVLLDINGHIKLADFGSCLKLKSDGTVQSNVAVGTPDYISPEILRAMEDGKGCYGKECDWWSLGICLYEMLFGQTPFYAESLTETYGKIMDHQEELCFPSEPAVSEEAKHLLKSLICPADQRFGKNGLSDFQNHAFFRDMDWENIRDTNAPYIPEISSPTDTSNFDVEESDFTPCETKPPNVSAPFTGHHLPFIGFTYTHNSKLSDSNSLAALLTKPANLAENGVVRFTDMVTVEAYERRIERLENEKTELDRKLKGSGKATRLLQAQFHGSNTLERNAHDKSQLTEVDVTTIAQLKDENQILRRRLMERESPSTSRKEANAAAASEELEQKCRDLQKKHRQLLSERNQLQEQFGDALERIKESKYQLKEAIKHRDMARQEFAEISVKVGELQSEKQKLLRMNRERDDECRTLQQKLDVIKTDVIKLEKWKREHELGAQQIQEECERERRLREEYERDLMALKAKMEAASTTTVVNSADQDEHMSNSVKKQNDLDRSIQLTEEALELERTRHARQVSMLESQLQEAKAQVQLLQAKMDDLLLQHKQERSVLIGEHEETLVELQTAVERERESRLEMQNQLQTENDMLKDRVDKLQMHVEEREKQLCLAQQECKFSLDLESRLAELSQWVSDEKEVRDYLQMLAAKLTDELERLKFDAEQKKHNNSGSVVGGPITPRSKINYGLLSSTLASGEKGWGSRRSHKLAKMEILDLQRNLQSEIRAKQEVTEELTKFRSTYFACKQQLEAAEVRIGELTREVHARDCQLEEAQRQLGVRVLPDYAKSLDQLVQFSSILNLFKDDEAASSGGSDSMNSNKTSNNNNNNNNNGTNNSRDQQIDCSGAVEFCDSPQQQQYPQQQQQQQQQQQPLQRREAMTVSPPNYENARGMNRIRARAPPQHRFNISVFAQPTKCHHCTSLMVGLTRQGLVCQDCQFACHPSCLPKAQPSCPAPQEPRRPLGIDPSRGLGTTYQGLVRVPKPGGLKKGWTSQLLVVCDLKLFLFDCATDRNGKPTDIAPHASLVLDMRDEDFMVSSVREPDVIHASRKELCCIFRVSASQLHQPLAGAGTGGVGGGGEPARSVLLLMAESQHEKQKWVIALNELLRFLRKRKLAQKKAFIVRELVDQTALPLVKGALCAAVVDKDRLLLGTDDGLYCVEVDRETVFRLGDGRRVDQIDFIADEHLIIVMTGKERQIKLIPTAALDGRDVKWIKVDNTKGCHTFCAGSASGSGAGGLGGGGVGPFYFCVAVKKTVVVFEINRTPARHKKLRELAMPGFPQFISIFQGKLCVGYPSGFRMWNLHDNSQQALLNLEDNSLQFVSLANYDACFLVQVTDVEYLLVFHKLGFYVDQYGKRSRPLELMFPSVPNHFAYSAPYLSVFSENHVCVFNVNTGEWVQTLNLKKAIIIAKPLLKSGVLTLCTVGDKACLVLLSDILADEEVMNVPSLDAIRQSKQGQIRKRRKYTLLVLTDEDRSRKSRKSVMISGPSDFSHVTHMGPGEGIEFQHLLDLNRSGQNLVSRNSSLRSALLTPHTTDDSSVEEQNQSRTEPDDNTSSSQLDTPSSNAHSRSAL
ncbi:Serine/threonine-protein kinase MRCK beta [Trichinella nelsoni]|uniref:non-specific serine/threonine protein kinase n=1 Tax=Trichinella nelsoni TaxID=6336 RepID=A0A0V0RYD6_9BILA|nr:Serine/threonine-protein kinase MRCK beta [Trichinella nelsoni]